MARSRPAVISVALNPCWDRTLEVPGLEVGKHVRGRLLAVQPAGKAVNVARLLDALGTASVLTGLVGRDDRDRFAETFAKTRVRVELFETAAATRENITLVDPLSKTDTHIRDVGSPPSEEDLARLARKLGILAAKGTYVLVTGSLPPGVSARTFAGLLEVCIDRGAWVAVDSSGPGLEAVRRVRGLWLIKPNREELAELTGASLPAETAGAEALEAVRAAAEPLRRRIDEVIVTLGAEGAVLLCRQGAWWARPHTDPATVLNTVGAGDALLAGYVHAHLEGRSPPERLRHGVACGTAATLQLRAGQVNPYDVQAVLEKVEVRPLQ